MKDIAAVLTLSVAITIGCTGQPAGSVADAVYTNGRIYTVNEAQPWAEAVAIKDGRFLVVGSNADVEAVTGDGTDVVDLAGRFVMPGLVDTHTHPFTSAIGQIDELEFDPVPANLQEIQEQIAAYVDARPDKTFWRAASTPKGIFPGENPHRRDLDAVVPDKPVCIWDQGGHAYWCNTIALEQAGIMDPDYQVPRYGVVERDEDGVPSGTVRETVLGEIDRVFLDISPEMNVEAAKWIQTHFNENGVTATRTADGNQSHARALKTLADNEDITLHWALGYDVNYLGSVYSFEERMEQIADRRQFASEFVDTDFAKIFLDGDVNGYGIAMLEPFPGTDGEYGSNVIEVEDLNRLTQQLDEDGVSIQYHAIGDRSIKMVADALELAAEANGGTLNTRHYPDHMGFPQRDLERLIRLNGLIGFAPAFGFDLPGVHDSYRQFVGVEKLRTIQPLRTALDGGAIIATGTDFASLPQDPWPLLEGVIHRRNPWVGEDESEPNNASEAITVEESIHAYTLGGAHALLKEDRIGSIEEGKYADFIVLSQNLLEIPVDDISETDVLATVFNGRIVYENGER